MTQAPAPGIYYNVPFAEYLEWEAISNTALHAAAESMAHFACRKPVPETRPMILGTLTHTAQFESSWVNQRFAFMPDYAKQVQDERAAWFDGVLNALENDLKTMEGMGRLASACDDDDGQSAEMRQATVAAMEEIDRLTKAIEKHKKETRQYERPSATTAYKKLVDKFTRDNASRVVVCEREFTDLIGMVRALSVNKRAQSFLKGGQYEVSIVAQDPVTGLLCKGRLDHVDWGRGLVTDLKSTKQCGKFESAISDFSYHRQLALYGDMPGWLPDFDELETRAIVAVESSEPYCVRSGALEADAIETGREEYRFLLNSIAAAKASGKWPGYPDPEVWRLPQWHKRPQQRPVNLSIGGQLIEV